MTRRVVPHAFALLSVSIMGTHALARTFTVVNTMDAGVGSLRWAIEQANLSAGPHRVTFDIPGGGVQTIMPLTALPGIVNKTAIDATTQPGYVSFPSLAGTPYVQLNGSLIGTANTPGLRITATADGSSVRGLSIGPFTGDGIYVGGADACTLAANHIGCDAAGTTSLPNGAAIMVAGGTGTVIGGSNARSRNVLSGNNYQGVNGASAIDLKIRGNYVGTTAKGTAALANLGGGVFLDRNVRAEIGGLAPGEGNLLSGNAQFGLYVRNNLPTLVPGQGHKIYGNWIGTDVYGTGPLPNTGRGLDLNTQYATVGDAAAPNVISGNDLHGIYVYGGLSAANNGIYNNFIGTTYDGTRALGNGSMGIWLFDTPNNELAGNVIAGNADHGVMITGDELGNLLRRNAIGTNRSGATDLGNGEAGIALTSGNVRVGGLVAGDENLIAFNAHGVIVQTGIGVDLRGNRIYSNTVLNIDLEGPVAGVTLNDMLDADSGPNNLQNFPTLTAVTYTGGQLHVQGSLESTANSPFAIDVYSSPSCHQTGYGGGETWVGRFDVMTNGSGQVAFEYITPTPAISGYAFTATATSAEGGGFLGSTSEFSRCVAMAPTVGVEPATPRVGLGLDDALPNPGTSRVTIGYTLSQVAPVAIRVYDVAGRMVRTLVNEMGAPGPHEVVWNTRDDGGLPVPPGVYFYRMSSGTWQSQRKVVLLEK
jgi:titin